MATLGEQLDIQLTAFATVVGNDMQALEALTGALVDLETQDKANLVAAINEVFFSMGDLSDLTTDEKSSLVLAVNEVVTTMGDLDTLDTTNKDSLVEAINEVFSLLGETDTNLEEVWEAIGDLSTLNTSAKDSLVLAINEVLTKQGNIASLTTSDKTSTVSAINEVKVLTEDNTAAIETVDDRVDDNAQDILDLASLLGNVNDLNTIDKASLVRAVNEVLANQGDITALDTTNKTSLVLAINEVWERANKSAFWGGAWSSKLWLYNEMSREGNWQGIVINVDGTTDHLEPQINGEEEDSIDESLVFTEAEHIGVVKMVHKFTFSEEGFSVKLDAKAVEADTNTVARITVANITQDKVTVFNSVVLGDAAWTLIGAIQASAKVGDEIEIWFEMYNSALAGAIDGTWTSDDHNVTTPNDGDFSFDDSGNPTQVSISHIDGDGGNRAAELDAIVVGSLIHVGETASADRSFSMEVTNVDTTNPNSTVYTGTSLGIGADEVRDNRLCNIAIDNPITLPTKYYVATDYYLGVTNQPSFANITTELYFDNVQQPSSTDGYAILFTFQTADYSADWDIMSDGSAAGGSTGGAVDSALVYDAETDTYYAKPTADGQVQDLGQEMFYRAVNDAATPAYALEPKVFMSIRADETYPRFESSVKVKSSDVPDGAKIGLNTTDALLTGTKQFKCTVIGKINQCDTSAWLANTVLYIDPVTEGNLTSIRPVSDIFPVAKVLVQSATDGVLDVNCVGIQRLDKQITSYMQEDWWLTADLETVTSPGTFAQALPGDKGILAELIGTASVNDNQTATSSIEYLFPVNEVNGIYLKGNYESYLDILSDNDAANELIEMELYYADEEGVPIDSAIPDNVIGSLGVKPISLYTSGVLNMPENTIENILLTTTLVNDFPFVIGTRLRAVVRISKVGAQGGAKDFNVYSGSTHNSRLLGRVQLNSDDVLNLSTAPGNDVTEALTDHEDRIQDVEVSVDDHEDRLIILETPLDIAWADLVALSSKKNGDRFNITDRKNTTYPDPMGAITLDSSNEFTYVMPSGIREIIEII